MISFAPSEEQHLAGAMLDEMARDLLRPAAKTLDDDGTIPSDLLDHLWSTGLVEAALAAEPSEPRSRTGSCIALEALGWADAALAVAIAAPLGFVQALGDHGTADQKAFAHDFAASPRWRGAALLVQEPGFGFDPADIATSATRVEDGYRLTGRKAFVPLPSLCTDFLVVARYDDGLAAFIVPADSAGIRIEAAAGTLGLKSLGLAEVGFGDVRLPATARLGGEGGCDVLALIASARIAAAAMLTGISRAVLDYLTPYLKDRVAHGTPLARKQSVAFRLADMATEIPAMRWMCWQAACPLERGENAMREARLAQIRCAEQAGWITDEGVQLMGGHGYMRENPVERWYRDSRMLASLEGVCGL
jgi:alkylation response protein AidB-like acyl-CoA dehydrogenase